MRHLQLIGILLLTTRGWRFSWQHVRFNLIRKNFNSIWFDSLSVTLWQGGKWWRGELLTVNFQLSKNCQKIFLSENVCPKTAKFGLVDVHFEKKLRAKIKILSTQSLPLKICNVQSKFCRTFATFMGKLQLWASTTFLTHESSVCWCFKPFINFELQFGPIILLHYCTIAGIDQPKRRK